MGRDARLKAVELEQAKVLDRLGRTLEQGDFIVANPQGHTLIQILDVRPQLDPIGPKAKDDGAQAPVVTSEVPKNGEDRWVGRHLAMVRKAFGW